MDWKETTKQPEPVREFSAKIGDVKFSAGHEPWGWCVRASRGSAGTWENIGASNTDRDAATHVVVSNARKLGWIE